MSYTINENYVRTEEAQAYVEMMVKERLRANKIPPSTKQCASTQRLLDMTDEELAAHRARKFPPDGWLAVPGAKNLDEAVGMRSIKSDDVVTYDRMRRTAKNELGQSEKDGSGVERKEAARQAYSHTPPAPLTEVQVERLTTMDKITALSSMPPEIETSFWSWLRNKFKKKAALDSRKRFSEEFIEEMGIKEKE